MGCGCAAEARKKKGKKLAAARQRGARCALVGVCVVGRGGGASSRALGGGLARFPPSSGWDGARGGARGGARRGGGAAAGARGRRRGRALLGGRRGDADRRRRRARALHERNGTADVIVMFGSVEECPPCVALAPAIMCVARERSPAQGASARARRSERWGGLTLLRV